MNSFCAIRRWRLRLQAAARIAPQHRTCMHQRPAHHPFLTSYSGCGALQCAGWPLLRAGGFCADSRYGGSSCSSDGTASQTSTSQSIAVRGPMGASTADGYCRLACNTTAAAIGVSPISVSYGLAYQGGYSVAQGGSRADSSRAVRITLDPRGASPRMLRVYYSPNEDFANLALAVAVEAPSKLQNALNATVGISATGVSTCSMSAQLCHAVALQPAMLRIYPRGRSPSPCFNAPWLPCLAIRSPCCSQITHTTTTRWHL